MRDAVSEWQALSALYEQAEALTAPELDRWLERLRREGHPRVGSLEQMLGARARVRDNGFLGALPTLPVVASGLGDDDRVGERIGPYRLLRRLGSGGMAEVWQAERDDGAFRRKVAIKLMFRHVGGAHGDSFAQRFTRERDILASLDHPNIAGLHDAGVTPAGQPWLALEYVEGEPLTAWCDRALTDVRARVAIFRQVLLAVEHAHANLVIHRDLKPANILVSAAGEVRLLDFGIAKLLEADGGVLADTELTRHAGRLMTVAYASPEQLTGRPLTTASDVYSLGVVLYELLCGERPYEVRTDSPARLEQAILETDPRPPSRRALGEAVAAARGTNGVALRKTLSHDLDAVVLKALAKQPARRYGSVEALRAELDRWLAGEPVEARAPGRAERAVKFVVRHPVGASLGTAAVVALMTVAGVAVALGLQAREESARALAARDFLMGMFKQADTDKSHGADVTARELLDRGRDDVLRRLKEQPALQADLLEGIAGIQSSMDELTKADVTFGALVDLYRRVGDPSKEAHALAARAEIALRMGRLDVSGTLNQAAASLAGAFPADVKLALSVQTTQGWLLLWEGQVAPAKSVFTQILKKADESLGKLSPEALSALVGLVHSNQTLHDYDTALQMQSELASRQVAVVDKAPRDLVELDLGRIELLYMAGKYREALARESEAMVPCVKLLGLDAASCRRMILVGARSKLRLEDATNVKQDLPVLERMVEDASSPDLQAYALHALIVAFSQLGQLHQHPELLEKAKRFTASNIEASQKIRLLQALAEDAIRRSRFDEAQQLLRRAYELRGPDGGNRSVIAPTATTQNLQAVVLLARGSAAEALVLMRQAQASEAAVFGSNHPQVLLHSLNEALTLATLGRPQEALKVIDIAEPVLRESFGSNAPSYLRLETLRAQVAAKIQDARVSADGASGRSESVKAGDEFEFFN